MTTATMPMMTAEDIRTKFGWSDDMIYSLPKTRTQPRLGGAKAQADTHMSITIANECSPSLDRQMAKQPNGDGQRPRHRRHW
jgi:hypothetical protein